MTDAIVKANGYPVSALRLHVANVGPWVAELDFEQAPELSGRVTIEVGDTQLVGTLLASEDGTHGLQRKCTVAAGAGAWGNTLAAKGYHNDAGVKAHLVAEDIAREAGETLGTFVPTAERLGNDYLRPAGTASTTLDDAAGGAPWWVDYAGVTQVGPRPAVALEAGTYEVLAYDPRARMVTFAVDSLDAFGIGAILTDRLDVPQTIRDYDITITDNALRVVAWTGGDEMQPGRLAGVLRRLVRRVAAPTVLHGLFKYRVVSMAVDGRVNLQAVRKAAGVPDAQLVAQWPGVAGAHAELEPGAEVLVQFIEGDRAQPIITHYAGKDGAGFVPVSLAFCGSTQAAARQGDLVQSGGVGTVCTFTPVVPSVSPMTPGTPYLVSFDTVAPSPVLAAPLYGAISSGSPKVRV